MTRIASLAALAVAVLLASAAAHAGRDCRSVRGRRPPRLAAARPRALSGAAIAREQAAFLRGLEAQIPAAEVGWRYRLVANGFSVSLPNSEVARLRALPGVRDVAPAGSYEPRQLASSPQQIGAPALWGETLDTAGQGAKIGIIDSGIDPEPPVLRSGGIHDARGLPERAAAIHVGEGHRRAGLRAEGLDRIERARCVLGGRLESRHVRRRDRRG